MATTSSAAAAAEQSTAVAAAAATVGRRPYAPYQTNQLYTFSGTLPGAIGYTFNVLAGYQPMTVTGGWANISVIDRPLRLGFTIPQGYDPYTATVAIQFENVVRQPHRGASPLSNVEFDIQKLEWMAGRGELYRTRQGASPLGPATGNPPLVTVTSLDSSGNPTNLIPPNLQGDIVWVITDIAYDTQVGSSSSGGQQGSGGVQRDRSGTRNRQAAVVTLMQYISGPGAENSPSRRQANRQAASGYRVYRATSERDTIQAIVLSINPTATASTVQSVISFNVDRLHVRSARQHLKIGTSVRVPISVHSFT
jgi:hypothetical protein